MCIRLAYEGLLQATAGDDDDDYNNDRNNDKQSPLPATAVATQCNSITLLSAPDDHYRHKLQRRVAGLRGSVLQQLNPSTSR